MSSNQATMDGLKRWFVWIDGKRRVTWATDEDAARAKAPRAERVEPAPPLA